MVFKMPKNTHKSHRKDNPGKHIGKCNKCGVRRYINRDNLCKACRKEP